MTFLLFSDLLKRLVLEAHPCPPSGRRLDVGPHPARPQRPVTGEADWLGDFIKADADSVGRQQVRVQRSYS